jgi:hypothetical protein
MYFTRLRLRHYNAKINETNETKRNIKIHKEEDTCIICLETTATNNPICKLKILIPAHFYYKSCHCDGLFHSDCLLKWIYVSKSCPICRIAIETNPDEKLPLTYNIYKKNKIFKIVKYFWMCILFKILLNIVFNIQYTMERKLENEN